MADDLKPVSILGGTFNPIHYGHLRLAQEIANTLTLDQLRLVPTGTPPHRCAPRVSAQHRLEMTKIAASGNTAFIVDDREVKRNDLCYTVDTLAEFREEFGTERSLCLVIGADAFLGLTTWHRWKDLFGLTHIIVARRPGFSTDPWDRSMPEALQEELNRRRVTDVSTVRDSPSGAILEQAITLLDISASKIRRGVRLGENVRYLLPDAVLDYIQRNHLYQDVDED